MRNLIEKAKEVLAMACIMGLFLGIIWIYAYLIFVKILPTFLKI